MVAWLSLVVAVGALGVAVLTDRRQSRALKLEETARKEDFQRVQGTTLVGEQNGSSGSSAGVEYPTRVRNLGPAPAKNVQVWIAERLPGGELAGAVTNPASFPVLIAEDGWREFSLHQPPRDEIRPRAGVIVAYWEDGNGEHRDVVIGTCQIQR